MLQDFTGVPCVVDLAAMRSAMARLGGNPAKINPLIPVDLVIDHSVQVDYFGSPDALANNVGLEFQRNRQRYEFLKWGQKALDNFRVVPPSVGIVHQVNLEFLAKGVFLRQDQDGPLALPDTLVGTDSHTTMINGLGVLGWGVGGIEAEAVMLGQPLYMLMPEVIGFELSGRLPPGATATDLVLTVTEILRREGVVGKFIEFFGPGVSSMKVADRATIANMSPEYGATMGFFPIDQQTLDYLRQTGRTEAEVQLVERYTKEQQLFRTDEGPAPRYTKILRLDLGTIEPSLAGPKRPQDRVPLAAMKAAFRKALAAPVSERGFALGPKDVGRTANVVDRRPRRADRSRHGGHRGDHQLHQHQQPQRDARGRTVGPEGGPAGAEGQVLREDQPGPGSRVVTDYLERSGLDKPLDALGFQTRRLRLHDLHRQQRPAAGAGGRRGRRAEPGGGGRAQRQPQLRGPHPSAGEGQLPGQPAAGRGLRPGRHHRHRPGHRAPGPGLRRAAGLPAGDLAHRRGGAGGRRAGGPAGDVPPAVRQRDRRQSAVERAAVPRKASFTRGTRRARTSRSRRFWSICPPSRGLSGRSAAPGCCWPWATR